MSLSTLAYKEQLRTRLHDYYALTKPTITLLVVVTILPSLLLASPQLPSLALVIYACLGTTLVSSSAAVFNQFFEGSLDRDMERTRNRSIPSGKVSSFEASSFGIFLGLTGSLILYFGTTPLAAFVAIIGHLFYVFIYTLYLKKRTAQNIVIGGAAGAVGPLIGWAAVTGNIGWPAWVLFIIIVLWTPPHFWALAIKYKKDYEKNGIPMYPVIYGDHKTRKAMMVYSISLVPFVLSLFVFKQAGLFYLVISSYFAFKFAIDSYQIYRSQNNEKMMTFFRFSCAYTFAIFGALFFDRLLSFLA